jgi:hypothetical protein
MLTVWCVCVGDKYTDEDVRILQSMVRQHMRRRYWFRCLSDRKVVGVDCWIHPDPWPGWWSKLHLFEVTDGNNLYLDLDTVITGDLDPLFSTWLSMPPNWGQSGNGGWQSSVMAWGEDCSRLPAAFDLDQLSAPVNGNYGYYGPNKLWGDQEYITDMMGEDVVPMRGVYSYKYHCRDRLPADCAVVAFHGRPKPDEVSDPWVIASRSMRIPA